jgi:hypothetical protein
MEVGAGELERMAQSAQEITSRLLKELEVHEGITYCPGPPVRRIYGGLTAMAPEPQIPRSVQLHSKAVSLRAQAARLRVQAPLDAGEMTAASVDGIYAGLLALDPTRILFPPVSQIIDAAQTALQQGVERMGRRRLNAQQGDPRPFHVVVGWKSGKISPSPRLELPEL